jgi:hypothetical protein
MSLVALGALLNPNKSHYQEMHQEDHYRMTNNNARQVAESMLRGN